MKTPRRLEALEQRRGRFRDSLPNQLILDTSSRKIPFLKIENGKRTLTDSYGTQVTRLVYRSVNARKAIVSSASICCAFGVVGVGAGARGRMTRERVQNGIKDAYEPTSETTAYSCLRVYLASHR